MSRRLTHFRLDDTLQSAHSGGLDTLNDSGGDGMQPAQRPSPFAGDAGRGVTPHLRLAPFLAHPATVHAATPATRVHELFVSLSLR